MQYIWSMQKQTIDQWKNALGGGGGHHPYWTVPIRRRAIEHFFLHFIDALVVTSTLIIACSCCVSKDVRFIAINWSDRVETFSFPFTNQLVMADLWNTPPLPLCQIWSVKSMSVKLMWSCRIQSDFSGLIEQPVCQESWQSLRDSFKEYPQHWSVHWKLI